jgi:dephospho-CoA kinase
MKPFYSHRVMMIIAVTGSIASGKSLFAGFLGRGAVVIDADRIGHEVIRKGGQAHDAVVAAFGPSILDAAGGIDRRILGTIVFNDPAERRRLEALVHPPLVAELARQVREAEKAGAPLVVVDAALIYELGLENEFDAVVAVSADRERQLEWLKARGLPEAEARRRIGAQLPANEKARRADFHVVNDDTIEALARTADRIRAALEGRAVTGPRSGTLFSRKEPGS